MKKLLTLTFGNDLGAWKFRVVRFQNGDTCNRLNVDMSGDSFQWSLTLVNTD